MRRLWQLEDENSLLKQVVADLTLDKQIVQLEEVKRKANEAIAKAAKK